jgi:hypothetical protein
VNLHVCPHPVRTALEIPRVFDGDEVKTPAKEIVERPPEVAVPEHCGIHSWTEERESDGQHDDRNYPDILSNAMLQFCIEGETHYKGWDDAEQQQMRKEKL